MSNTLSSNTLSSNTSSFTLEIDVCWDLPFDQMSIMMETFNATSLKIIKAIGPGGGNPLVEISFTNEIDMENFYEFYISDDPIESIS